LDLSLQKKDMAGFKINYQLSTINYQQSHGHY
jgi:hypothetical protein